MKISKLFHWLYAFVMALPIFAIGINCLYVVFNKNAYQSYSYRQDNNLKKYSYEFDDMVRDEVYTFDFTRGQSWNTTITLYGDVLSYMDYSGNETTLTGKNRIFLDNNSTEIVFFGDNTVYRNTQNTLSVTFKFTNYVGDGELINLVPYNFNYDDSYYLDNVFYIACDKVTKQPIFSWAYNSFLSAPLVYIVGLFSIPTNSIIVQLLSYWLAISIIWLVFDLIMWVPLLAHRWLDKGVLE